MAGRLAVVAVEDSHVDMLAEFFRLTWDPSSTAEQVLAARHIEAARNCSEPGSAPPACIAVQDKKIIGYCASLPVRLWSSGIEHRAYWAKGLMVLPEFRGGPIGYHVLSALSKSWPLMAAVTVAEGSKRLFGALGYRDHGAIPNLVRHTRFRLALTQIRPLNIQTSRRSLRLALGAASAARRIGLVQAGGWLADGLTGPVWRTRVANGSSLTVESALPVDQVDRLWEASRDELGALPVRDSLAWSERYAGQGPQPYRFICLWRHERIVGVAVLKSPRVQGDPRLAGLRMASVSDLLIHPADTEMGTLLAGAEDHAAVLGAGAVILSVSNRQVVDVARRRGYVARPGNIHFFLRSASGGSHWPLDLSDWWLTRGDGESDATF